MRAQTKPRVGRGVGFGVPGQIDVGFYIPEQTKVAVAHRPNARGEFGEKPRFSGRLLHHAHAQAHQVIKHVAERVIIFKHRVGITTRRRRQR